MFAYIFMHNMIIENEYDVNVAIKEQMKVSTPKVKIVVNKSTQFQEILTWRKQIKDRETHITLQNALIEYLLDEYSNLSN